MGQFRQGAVVLLLASILSACSVMPRPTPPPAGAAIEQPWGSIALLPSVSSDKSFSASLVAAVRTRFERQKTENETGKIPFRALTLSGGGSRGAYGAGVLSGWTENGDRPEFDVVTGVSTGALMATHAFLGSDFDDDLALFKRIRNKDVFREHGMIARLRLIRRLGAAFETTPLRETLQSIISQEMLDLVAAEHRAGRRLFVGTTNLDANLFTIWNMGIIAASDRPDRLERYLDVIMASAAFPIVFPPVYIEVEGKDATYTQMHTDGGIRESVFFFDFTEELYRAAEAAGLGIGDFKQELYILNNGPLASSGPRTYKPVKGTGSAVADATMTSLMTKVTHGSLFRLWVRAMIRGSDFNIGYVPSDFEFTSGSLTFDPAEQKALFDLGYQQALEGSVWATARKPATTEELLELIVDTASTFDRNELPAWLHREKKSSSDQLQ